MHILENVEQKHLFTYIVVIIVVAWMFHFYNVKLNIVFGTIVAMMLVALLYINNSHKQKDKEQLASDIVDAISPAPTHSIEFKHSDIVDFLYTIADYYPYNTVAYENLVDELDYFSIIYERVFTNIPMISQYYDILMTTKANILNTLHSFIYKIPVVEISHDRLKYSIKEADKILSSYIEIIHQKYKDYVYINGLTSTTKLIETGPKAYDYYEKTPYTFDIY